MVNLIKFFELKKVQRIYPMKSSFAGATKSLFYRVKDIYLTKSAEGKEKVL